MPQKSSSKEKDIYTSLLNLKIENPYYYRRHGISYGSILLILFCSKIKTTERYITYILYITNIIPHQFIKENGNKINHKFLETLLKQLIGNEKILYRKDLMQMIGFKDSETFIEYFGDFLVSERLDKKRKFNLNEILKILEFWQGTEKKGRIETYTKEELAFRLFTGSDSSRMEKLEASLTEHIGNGSYNKKYLNVDYYKKHRFIKPKIVVNYLHDISKEKNIDLEEDTSDKESELLFIFFLYLIKAFKLN